MHRTNGIRTGIDLGWGSAKLVTGRGKKRLETITHVGAEAWEPPPQPDMDLAVEREAEALERLLKRLSLPKRALGRIAVSVDTVQASLREVVLPALNEKELEQALPFEARKHLDLEHIEFPVLSSQILGPAPAMDEEHENKIRVLLAAVPKARRDHPIRVLRHLGLEPEVVDLDPLAGLNELMARLHDDIPEEAAVGLLDLGGRQASLHLASRRGGILSRPVGPGVPPDLDSAEQAAGYAELLSDRLKETLHFYQGRHRQNVARLYLSGGGALVKGISEALGDALRKSVEVLDSFADLDPETPGLSELEGQGTRFVRAFGLCRWGDEHV